MVPRSYIILTITKLDIYPSKCLIYSRWVTLVSQLRPNRYNSSSFNRSYDDWSRLNLYSYIHCSSAERRAMQLSCMDKMWNLGISFLGNFPYGGKSLQFWGEIYHLDGYFCLFLTNISENLFKKMLTHFVTIFLGNVAFLPARQL